MPFANRKNYFRGSFHSSIVTIQKISPLWKPEINNLGIFQSLKLRILMEKIPPSSKLKCTASTLGVYGFSVLGSEKNKIKKVIIIIIMLKEEN